MTAIEPGMPLQAFEIDYYNGETPLDRLQRLIARSGGVRLANRIPGYVVVDSPLAVKVFALPADSDGPGEFELLTVARHSKGIGIRYRLSFKGEFKDAVRPTPMTDGVSIDPGDIWVQVHSEKSLAGDFLPESDLEGMELYVVHFHLVHGPGGQDATECGQEIHSSIDELHDMTQSAFESTEASNFKEKEQ